MRSPDELYAEQDPLNLDFAGYYDSQQDEIAYWERKLADDERWAIEAFLSVPGWYWERRPASHDRILLLLASGDPASIHEAADHAEYVHERIADWASD
jgi:hypothetical protein